VIQVSRALVGASAACILFFFLLSGLLGGTAFPQLDGPGENAAQSRPPDPAPEPTTDPAPAVQPAAQTTSPDIAQGLALASQQPPAPSAPAETQEPGREAGGNQGGSVDTQGGPAVSLESSQFALLVVWCFVAGFSERLIPSLLASTEARAGGTDTGSDRFRPTPGNTEVQPPTTTSPTPAARPDTRMSAGDSDEGATKEASA